MNVEETAGKIQNDNMPDEDFYKFLLAAFGCMNENLADDGSIGNHTNTWTDYFTCWATCSNQTGTEDDDTRSNARTLDKKGNEWLAGKLTVGTAPADAMDVATKKYVDDLIAELKAKIEALTPASA